MVLRSCKRSAERSQISSTWVSLDPAHPGYANRGILIYIQTQIVRDQLRGWTRRIHIHHIPWSSHTHSSSSTRTHISPTRWTLLAVLLKGNTAIMALIVHHKITQRLMILLKDTTGLRQHLLDLLLNTPPYRTITPSHST